MNRFAPQIRTKQPTRQGLHQKKGAEGGGGKKKEKEEEEKGEEEEVEGKEGAVQRAKKNA